MADQPYTEADVRLVAEWLRKFQGWPEIRELDREYARDILGALAAAGRLLQPDGASHGICGEHAPSLFGADLELQVCELLAGHDGWHGCPNAASGSRMSWSRTEDFMKLTATIVQDQGSTDE